MAGYANRSGGMLILPDGTEAPDGTEVEISADTTKNVAVAEWIAKDWLVKAKTPAKKPD